MIKKSIRDWEKEYDVRILDPDGFDRSAPELYNRLFTEKEFRDGLFLSTILAKPGGKWSELVHSPGS